MTMKSTRDAKAINFEAIIRPRTNEVAPPTLRARPGLCSSVRIPASLRISSAVRTALHQRRVACPPRVSCFRATSHSSRALGIGEPDRAPLRPAFRTHPESANGIARSSRSYCLLAGFWLLRIGQLPERRRMHPKSSLSISVASRHDLPPAHEHENS